MRDVAAVSVKTRDDVNDKYGGVGLLVHVPCGAIIGEDSPGGARQRVEKGDARQQHQT